MKFAACHCLASFTTLAYDQFRRKRFSGIASEQSPPSHRKWRKLCDDKHNDGNNGIRASWLGDGRAQPRTIVRVINNAATTSSERNRN
mmetsp:Transcript_17189/g.47601  ORF Transcript_17189/g.47601 Transcript_17189/m.47601 type:complete len:88 (-) Transcript_17189:299-562(-)